MAEVALIVDDEPFNLSWMVDFLESKGIEVEFAQNYVDGVDKIKENKYRFIICDLNIPAERSDSPSVIHEGVEFSTYPGAYLAAHVRTQGYRNRQVFVYSVHRDPSVMRMMDKIGSVYLIKGRPKQAMEEIESILNYDPEKEK